MSRPEYPTSIRLSTAHKRSLRKHAEKYHHSLAGLIQMILLQWLDRQPAGGGQVAVGEAKEPPAAVKQIEQPSDDKPIIGVAE